MVTWLAADPRRCLAIRTFPSDRLNSSPESRRPRRRAAALVFIDSALVDPLRTGYRCSPHPQHYCHHDRDTPAARDAEDRRDGRTPHRTRRPPNGDRSARSLRIRCGEASQNRLAWAAMHRRETGADFAPRVGRLPATLRLRTCGRGNRGMPIASYRSRPTRTRSCSPYRAASPSASLEADCLQTRVQVRSRRRRLFGACVKI